MSSNKQRHAYLAPEANCWSPPPKREGADEGLAEGGTLFEEMFAIRSQNNNDSSNTNKYINI